MDALGISPFDLAVIGILLIGALSGLVTGFVRGGLFLLSWAGAGAVTVFGFPTASPYAREYIDTPWIADLVGGTVLFVVALIILHLVSQLLSKWVRSSRLNALDRSFGLLAGLGTAAVAIAVGFLFLSDIWAQDPPDWVREARTRPAVESAALLVRDVLPESIVGTAGEQLEIITKRTQGIDSAREAIDRLSLPPKTPASSARPGYNERERQELDRLIQNNQ
ncbi:MAG: CvpA family protein [Alphaproteobacteria bacterium]|nr:CvpA family protein [Alphaproteobacteria bacterium]